MINSLIARLNESTCNFMAVACMKHELDKAGFTQLHLSEQLEIQPGGKYYIIRNDSAIIPFIAGSSNPAESGFRIISAHSDSPCFKIKPNPEIIGDDGLVSLNVEKYGGAILYTWFDRPLSISGRVAIKGKNMISPEFRLIDLKRPVATIPHLAIHFNRAVNEGNPLSVQKDMKPVLGRWSDSELKEMKRRGGVVKSLIADSLDIEPDDILSMELNLYPYIKAEISGANGEFLQSPRIDDLSMAFTGLQALLDTANATTPYTRVLAIFDNEETGSGTRQGAASPTLKNLMQRISFAYRGNGEDYFRSLESTFMISADDAHAWHPNYNEKYDPTNHPQLGGGPVVKINANCKYMTDSRGAAVFAALCNEAGVNCQWFVNHADVAGGSTLGNILTSQMDIAGVDVGCAIWAMHSACETASLNDHIDMLKVFKLFFNN